MSCGGRASVILMSVRPGAPYADSVQEEGRVLVYEGHDRPRVRGSADPKTLDQELESERGTPTQNGLFFAAARRTQDAGDPAELVRVYEKVRTGIWVYNGAFGLLDAWAEQIDGRRVFKFDSRWDQTNQRPLRLANPTRHASSQRPSSWKSGSATAAGA
jgi:hypothetical protein